MSDAYARAGVDIATADQFVEMIAPLAAATTRPEVLSGVGGFAAHVALPMLNYRAPVLVSSTDGVGTKLHVAIETGRLDTIGIDLVAMCVNDIACSGATPLFFLDYFATGKLDPAYHAPIIAGVARACTAVGCALVGGETAEMPGLYRDTEFDLAGFSVGVVERDAILDGKKITPGDTVIGIASTGFHSNGYSLLRKLVREQQLSMRDPFPKMSQSVGDVLLTPTALYSPLVAALQAEALAHGIAHITGGGITGNLPRVLPDACCAVIDWSHWQLPAPFAVVQEWSGMQDDELRTVLNCGVGLIIVCAPANAARVMTAATAAGFGARTIGEIVARSHANDAAIRYI